tara:strand:+ start:2038 stop:2250 length:213 start_codon:yes stop_codon:yes gene_type:complete
MKRIGLFFAISSIPMIFITTAWILSFGMFNWIEAIRSEGAFFFNVIFIPLAFIAASAIDKVDVEDFYKSF